MAKGNVFNSFDGFGVEVYEGSELNHTRYFDGMKEAAKYAGEKESQGYKVRFATVNMWGIVIDYID